MSEIQFYVHVGTYSYHVRKQMGCFGCRLQRLRKAEGLQKSTSGKNQIWRNVPREASTKVVICN